MSFLRLPIILTILFTAHLANSQMVLEYLIEDLENPVILPLRGEVDVTVNWGDDTPIELIDTAGDLLHSFTSLGTQTITISGKLTGYGGYSTFKYDGRRWSKGTRVYYFKLTAKVCFLGLPM